MMFLLVSAVLLSLSSLPYTQTCKTPWLYCGSSGSSNGVSVDAVQVANCCSLPCYLTKGENVSVTIIFTSDENFDSLVLHLCGQFYGSCIDFPLESSDICSYVSCPMEYKKQYKMKLNFFIKSYWQSVSATAKWMVEDADGDQKGCFQLPVVIRSPNKKPEYTPEAGPPKNHTKL